MFVRVIGIVLPLLVAWVVFARPSSGSQPGHTYTVRPHDTLWSIAASRYGGDPREGVWKLQRRNHLSGTVIRVGQRLVVP
jgi:LysM repeat protein